MYDIIIIGAGPSGLTACIYSCLANKKVLVLEKEAYGGQILKTNKVRNYPGFENISGYDFATNLYNQAKNLGPDIKFEEVLRINNGEIKKVITKNNTYEAKAIIIASGSTTRKLPIAGIEKFDGKGISYCATCDGNFYKGKDVAVVGGGNTAIDEALYLSDICNKVYIVYRRKEFSFNSINLEKLKERKNVSFILNSNVVSVNGEDKLESIIAEDVDTKEKTTLEINGLFVAIGSVPVSDICNDIIDTNESGYIKASEDCKTNIDGIFVCGDIREKQVRQLTTACSDGTTASINACKYIATKK